MHPPCADRLRLTLSNDSRQSTQHSHEIDDIVTKTQNDQSPSNTKHAVRSTSNEALLKRERQQKYWKRNREKINQRRRESRKYMKEQSKNLGTTALDRERKAALNREHQQRYRELHKEKIYQHQMERRKQLKNAEINETPPITQTSRRKRLRNAEPNETPPITQRARRKCLRNAEPNETPPITETARRKSLRNVKPSVKPPSKPPITETKRRKSLRNAQPSVSLPIITQIESLKNAQASVSPPITQTERMKSLKNEQPSVTPSNLNNIDATQIKNEEIADDEGLSLNTLTAVQKVITSFIKSREGLTVYTLNCQSLIRNASDSQNSICKKSNFLLLSETWLPEKEDFQLPNFNCIAKFKRENVKNAPVTIHKNDNTSHITTLNIDLRIYNATEVTASQTPIGDLCVSHIKMDDGREILMTVVYISPNQTIQDIITFLHMRLLPYCKDSSRVIQNNSHELPMILAGDFNVDFETNDVTQLVMFLDEVFQLRINKDPIKFTTVCEPTIDIVFTRYLDDVVPNTFFAYFNHHRPIVTSLLPEIVSTATIKNETEIEISDTIISDGI